MIQVLLGSTHERVKWVEKCKLIKRIMWLKLVGARVLRSLNSLRNSGFEQNFSVVPR